MDAHGRQTGRATLTTIITQAQTHGLLDGHPAELAQQFAGLLSGDLMTTLLLRIAEPPDPREIGRRATSATAALLRLHAD